MKSIFALFSLFILTPAICFSYIVPTRSILQKTSDNAGSGIYAIEQEVAFTSDEQTYTFKETWIIESDRSMRVTVRGPQGAKEQATLQFVYQGDNRFFLQDKQVKKEKISGEFIERFFNMRSSEIFASVLANNKIIPNYAMQKKSLPPKSADIKHLPESWIRYARVDGVVTYALGVPTPVKQDDNNPGAWIQQDEFLLRKLRFPSQAEITASNYNSFSKGLSYPRSRVVRFENNTVTVKLLSVTTRTSAAEKLVQPSSLDLSTNLSALESLPSKTTISEFYKRFR